MVTLSVGLLIGLLCLAILLGILLGVLLVRLLGNRKKIRLIKGMLADGIDLGEGSKPVREVDLADELDLPAFLRRSRLSGDSTTDAPPPETKKR